MRNLIKKIKNLLPISKKSYLKDLENIYKIVQGLRQAETQHSQMEMNIINSIAELQQVIITKKRQKNGEKKASDPAFG